MKSKGRGFYDLSVDVQSTNQATEILTTLADLGYNTVALNQIIDESVFENSKKKKKGPKETYDPIPAPFDLSHFSESLRSQLKILNRITVELSNPVTTHKMAASENFRKYDIHAIVPTSMPALQHTCKSLHIDIISIDPCNKSTLRWNTKLYKVAVERGIWFELPYANSVLDTNARKLLINTGHSYHTYGKSKNILISSGAKAAIQVRGPYDVINIGLLLGLSEEQSKNAITHAGKSVVLQAESRRRGKAVILMEQTTEAQDDEESTQLEPPLKKMCIENQ